MASTIGSIKGFTQSHLNKSLFTDILKGIDQNAILQSWSTNTSTKSTGFTTETLNKKQYNKDRLLGLFPCDIEYTVPNSQLCIKRRIMIKSKAGSHEMMESFTKLIPDSEQEFLKLFKVYEDKLDLKLAEYRELACVQLDDETIKSLMPEIYWSWTDPDQDIFVFAMEYLGLENMTHMDTINDMSLWQEKDTSAVLDGIALLHAKFYNNTISLPESLKEYICDSYLDNLIKFKPLWQACVDRNFEKGVWTKKGFNVAKTILSHLSEISDHIATIPKTFVHGDVNAMNMALRKHISQDKHRLCLYDWELCTIGHLHQDLAIFLWFQVHEGVSQWQYYMRKYFTYFTNHLKTFHKVSYSLKNNSYDSDNPTQNDGAVSGGCDPEADYLKFEKDFDMFMCGMYISRMNWTLCLLAPVYNLPFLPRIMSNGVEYVSYVTEKYNFV